MNFPPIGYTDHALFHPLSEGGVNVVAVMNGVRPSQLPVEARYAPNKHMHEWLEALAVRMGAGLPIKNGDRYITLSQLKD